jgi:hypothetical protein
MTWTDRQPLPAPDPTRDPTNVAGRPTRLTSHDRGLRP